MPALLTSEIKHLDGKGPEIQLENEHDPEGHYMVAMHCKMKNGAYLSSRPASLQFL